MILDYTEVFVESTRPNEDISVFSEQELKFLEDKKLINKYGNQFSVNFVGEIITPESKFFSLPKNFQKTEENIQLFKRVLNDYKVVLGKPLITNNTFIVSTSGEIKSERFYYNELKNFFLDFITYEFIYPRKTIKQHSTNPISGGKIDIQSTIRNRKRLGPGITYNIKDVKNTKDWNLDDIYWSVIDYLSTKYEDRKEIDQMKDFLKSQGYEIKKIDISDSQKMIKDIEKCDVGIIHNPIKNTLLSYFKSTTVKESYKLNVFYTDNFAFVWEELCRHSLKENKKFRTETEKVFFRKESRTKWFPDENELNKFISTNRVKLVSKSEATTGIRVTYEIDVKSIPDIFSEHNGRRFIGDAKYYQDPENASFDKEFRTYNSLINNEYPMVVFTPSNRTRVLHVREEGDLELVIFKLSVEQVISDAVNKTDGTIDRVHAFLLNKGYTKRWKIS